MLALLDCEILIWNDFRYERALSGRFSWGSPWWWDSPSMAVAVSKAVSS